MIELHQVKNLDELLIYLNSLYPKYIDFDLSRIKKLLKRLGNPEKKLSKVIHVAGTNGKGSTIAFINSIAKVYGLKVHTYTSPHLISFNERIKLNGEIISPKVWTSTKVKNGDCLEVVTIVGGGSYS